MFNNFSETLLMNFLRIDKGDHNISGSLSGGQPFVVVRQSSRVHEHPTFLRGRNSTVVANESATATLENKRDFNCSLYSHTYSLPLTLILSLSISLSLSYSQSLSLYLTFLLLHSFVH